MMKGFLKKKLILLLTAALLFSALTGCAGEGGGFIEKEGVTLSEKKAGISFDSIVCRYEIYPSFSADNRPTAYTLYADNTVKAEKRDYAEGSLDFNDYWTVEQEFAVTEEQKQAVINAIRENRLWKVGKCSDTNVTDSATIYIILFDESGEAVSTNGGYHPTNRRFRAVKKVIEDIIN